jgi:hypothetical protein
MTWTLALRWLLVALIFICAIIVLLTSIAQADRTAKRDWRKFQVRGKPLPDSRSSIEVFRRIRGQQ